MGKRLSQLNEVEQVSSTDYLLVDGEEYLESKKILIKNIDIKDFNTEKLDRDLEGKQEVLIDGKNVKTINGESILGEGNLTIKGGEGGSGEVDQIFNPQSQNAQSGKAVAGALEGVSKVYVGSGDMPDGYNIQIDPSGEVLVVDQTFSPTSGNPQSGKAVAEAIGNIEVVLDELHSYAQALINGGEAI